MNELDLIKKNEVAKAMTEVEFCPTIANDKVKSKASFTVPWTLVNDFGIAFRSITSVVQSFMIDKGGSGFYFVDTKGGTMFKSGGKFIGNIMDKNGAVGGGLARLSPIGADPTMLCVAMAVASIEQQLGEIQKTQQEIVDFLVQKERSEIHGSINFLSDVLNNYKFNCMNEKYKFATHQKALDIKCKAEEKIDFFRNQIESFLDKKSPMYLDKDIKKSLESLQEKFGDYQLALYMFSFSSFLDVLLLENYNEDYLKNIKNKIENYSLMYRELYTTCYNKFEQFNESSVQAKLLKGMASARTGVGKIVEKMPLISKTQLDENLIESGTKMERNNAQRIRDKMSFLVEKQNSFVHPFIEQLDAINEIYNEKSRIAFDKDNIYLIDFSKAAN